MDFVSTSKPTAPNIKYVDVEFRGTEKQFKQRIKMTKIKGKLTNEGSLYRFTHRKGIYFEWDSGTKYGCFHGDWNEEMKYNIIVNLGRSLAFHYA
ncbi:hypothetical protein [Maridesulfovibrio bastinii]|uniref:hypothetical protein n=1 Tax=Maridesulfovibrio bastinii TaxID=47157 RepID=UPI00042A0435|nr:hypothetical protein [Maridesulfovibrio bastinii]